MLNRFRTRHLLALAALAGVTNVVGPLAAQGPGRRTGARAPTLISDCDYFTSGCGGDPTFEDGGDGGGGGGSTGPGECGSGARVKCREDNTYKCLKWVPQTVSGGVGTSGGGGTTVMVCSESIYTQVILYWP